MSLSILDKILLMGPTPISTTFLSYLTPSCITSLLSLSRTLRTSLLDPSKYGWIFTHLSLNTPSSPFHRLPKQTHSLPWKTIICSQTSLEKLRIESLSHHEVARLLTADFPPLTRNSIKYLNLDYTILTHTYPFSSLRVLKDLEALEELSLKWTRGVGIQVLGITYLDPMAQNPRLKKISYYGMELRPSFRGGGDRRWKIVDELEAKYETDVTRCQKDHKKKKRSHILTAKEEKMSVTALSIGDSPDRCQVICERKVWTCTACGKKEKNMCLWEIIPGVCEICEEYYCDECVPLTHREIYNPNIPKTEQVNGMPKQPPNYVHFNIRGY
ncbi:hypothetical protein TWF281_011115 [Arthrobotrys megalospora]